ncbi:hypothetical protein ABH935_009223 [Catenulispora sp. GAS73]|uniref:hypothetical protein n=1 Tax=Catenulispora sp. GAS73 TaxID=3156269 RepID=UPI003516F0D4
MDAFLKDGHPLLGNIPGPLALAAGHDGVVWAAGGAGESAVLWLDDEGWRAERLDAQGLRAVLPLDAETAVVAGEYGYLAIVGGEEGVREVRTGFSGCLYGLTRIGEVIWVTGDDGFVATLVPGSGELRVEPSFTGGNVVCAVAAPEGDTLFVAGSRLLRRSADGEVDVWFSGTAPLTDAVYAPDGSLAVSGDVGQLYLAAPGELPVRCDGVRHLDLECLHYDPRRDGFLVAGEDGFVGVLGRDGVLQALPAADPPYRLTSVLPWGAGHLFTGWMTTRAPYRFRGAVYFDGAAEAAPSRVRPVPRQDFGPPRVRTVGDSGRTPVAVEDFEEIPLEAAKERMPGVVWPDFPRFERVRFYDGDLHVADVADMLEYDERAASGYAVAIRGDLIVDGTLDATAGGDGYGSLLVVQGDVWAEAALFRYGIAAAIGGTLEVATVVQCDHGDDGGTLWAKTIRAQVVFYSLYFPQPEGEIDAFLIGDVYGDTSFPPERANEVFVPGVLEDGVLEEHTAASWLREGRSILREA